MKQWKESLNFIKALMEVCGSDVNQGIQKKTYTRLQKVPKKEEDQYMKGSKLYVFLWYLFKLILLAILLACSVKFMILCINFNLNVIELLL